MAARDVFSYEVKPSGPKGLDQGQDPGFWEPVREACSVDTFLQCGHYVMSHQGLDTVRFALWKPNLDTI